MRGRKLFRVHIPLKKNRLFEVEGGEGVQSLGDMYPKRFLMTPSLWKMKKCSMQLNNFNAFLIYRESLAGLGTKTIYHNLPYLFTCTGCPIKLHPAVTPL